MKKDGVTKIKKGVLKMENWNIECGNSYFPIQSINFILKIEATVLRITFPSAVLDHTFVDSKQRDVVYNQIKDWLNTYAKLCIERSKNMRRHIDTTTNLQKKMLKEGCKHK